MKESLSEKQRRFTRMIAELILWAYERDMELTLGDAYRDPRLHGEIGEKKGYGSANSCHKIRLAIDLNLFVAGRYMSTTDAYSKIGEQWEKMGGTWGGRFSDGNHFSLEHEGKK